MAINEENNLEEKKSISFVEQLVEEDLKEGKNGGRIQTRFPPEPNGYLHIGHAKAICMDFGVAEKYNGVCNLRFDDTNPSKENNEYVENILQDIQWLGFKWGNIYYASDYFEKLWDFAVWMIKKGNAYIDEQTAEEIAQHPAIDLILAVFFFAKLGTAYFDYRKHGQFEWAAPAILFACLVFTLTAPTYIWKILGI